MEPLDNDLREHLRLRAARNAPDTEQAIASARAATGHPGKNRRWLAAALVAAAVVTIVAVTGLVLRGNRQPDAPAGQLPVSSKSELINTRWEPISYRVEGGPSIELGPTSFNIYADFSSMAVIMPEWCNKTTGGPWDVENGRIDVQDDRWAKTQRDCIGGTPPPADYNVIVDTRMGVMVFLAVDKQTMTLRFGGGEVELRRIK